MLYTIFHHVLPLVLDQLLDQLLFHQLLLPQVISNHTLKSPHSHVYQI